jgi:hypothetical protein
MSTQFGWWVTDPMLGKFQVRAVIHGGILSWFRKQGHFASWVAHDPSEDDWNRLVSEAERRVPRRLISPKQFTEIKNLREHR